MEGNNVAHFRLADDLIYDYKVGDAVKIQWKDCVVYDGFFFGWNGSRTMAHIHFESTKAKSRCPVEPHMLFPSNRRNKTSNLIEHLQKQ